jgi:hypothetical protein
MKSLRLIITGSALLLATTALQVQAYDDTKASGIGGMCCPFSDEKLKFDIKPLTQSTQKLLELKGTTFKWKDSGREDIGVIAQDVEKVYPELVRKDKKHLQVDYEKLTAPLIEAVRELDARIKVLESGKAAQPAHAH